VAIFHFGGIFQFGGHLSVRWPSFSSVAIFHFGDHLLHSLMSCCRCKPFPELDKTGEELDLLGQLYGLFQKFIRFDKRFRDTLWAEVDLDNTNKEV